MEVWRNGFKFWYLIFQTLYCIPYILTYNEFMFFRSLKNRTYLYMYIYTKERNIYFLREIIKRCDSGNCVNELSGIVRTAYTIYIYILHCIFFRLDIIFPWDDRIRSYYNGNSTASLSDAHIRVERLHVCAIYV